MDTIAAISTPYGIGGIAVIRVSGDQAIAIVEALTARHLSGRVHYCRIADLDDVVVTLYRAPHSFTGEEVAEISCHGSLYIQEELMRRLIGLGCRTARAGEFTQRAFLNGKMDLSAAEAVADLIAAQTKAEKDLALKQMRGGIAEKLQGLRDKLLELTSLLELELDFADHEELEFADRSQLQALCDTIAVTIDRMVGSFRTGNAIRNGIKVAIVGPANAGKSTLLNALLGEERAIVSAQAGTTRDTIEDTLIIDGILFRFIDTAGLRETQDEIESLGIARSHKAIEQAHIILALSDATRDEQPDIEVHEGQTLIRVVNKADLVPGCHGISAKNGELGDLREQLVAAAGVQSTDELLVSNARHYEALTRALKAIRQVQKGLQQGLSGELLSMDLQDCLQALGEITGQITTPEVLNTIFSKFCIGK